MKRVDNAPRELREWRCHGREAGGEQKLCLEIVGEAQAEGDKERRVALRLSAKGIPVYEMVQEIPAGERLDEMRMWRRLTQSLARDWELPREGAERLLYSDFYF